MSRKLDNILIDERGERLSYTPVNGGPTGKNYPTRVREEHGKRIENQFKRAWEESRKLCESREVLSISERDGVYLQIKGQAGFDLLTKSLEDVRQHVRLLNVQEAADGVISATVYVPNSKHDFFIKKVNKYIEKDSGTDVISTIESIQSAMFEAFWIGTAQSAPSDDEKSWCEVWLRCNEKESKQDIKKDFVELCSELEMETKDQFISFPERVVVGVLASRKQLAGLLSYNSRIAEYRKMASPNSFFTNLSQAEMREWSDDLANRIDTESIGNTSVCLLDTGVNNGHPILEKVLADGDKHTVDLGRGVDDKDGHGTKMAGIAALFILEDKLESMEAIEMSHFLESVKILDNPDDNPEELYGEITSSAISLAEIEKPNINRAICMAITAPSNMIKEGRPSSWSGAVDAIVSGTNEEEVKRLMFVSAGNTTIEEIVDTGVYLDAVSNHSVEDPGQAWNALTVGAYTELDEIEEPIYRGYEALAKKGGVSPYSSSSLSWDYKKWPIKPEIMFEGGNLAYNKDDNFYSEADDLQLLTTGHKFLTGAPFEVIGMTSSATAQASWMAANIWNKCDDLWAETIRALMVHSADWTEEMKKSICPQGLHKKRDYRKLLRMCGYGVPNLERALWSASNSVNLIIQDELTPFIKKQSGITSNEMHIHSLPWPSELLVALEDKTVKMRVTLSYYIEPGPGEIGWKDKYRYPSCGLSFDVNNPTEDKDNFTKRISKAMRDDESDKPEVENDSSRWILGTNNRNVGSIHSDTWIGSGASLSESNMIVVYPKTGWWKTRRNLKKYDSRIRYSLVVTIESPELEVDFYTAIQTEIKNKTVIKTMVTAL